MYNYFYITTINLPKQRTNYRFETNNIDELCFELNRFYLDHSGLDELFNRDKLQNYISGRSKKPIWLKNLKIQRRQRKKSFDFK